MFIFSDCLSLSFNSAARCTWQAEDFAAVVLSRSFDAITMLTQLQPHCQ